MDERQKRECKEYEDLNVKIENISEFLSSNPDIKKEDYDLLATQRAAMQVYSAILRLRIDKIIERIR